MKVEIQIQKDLREPWAVIHAGELTPEIQQAAALLEGEGGGSVVAEKQERLFVLRPEEIYMIRVENEKTLIYTRDESYLSGKRLYELETALGGAFLLWAFCLLRARRLAREMNDRLREKRAQGE